MSNDLERGTVTVSFDRLADPKRGLRALRRRSIRPSRGPPGPGSSRWSSPEWCVRVRDRTGFVSVCWSVSPREGLRVSVSAALVTSGPSGRAAQFRAIRCRALEFFREEPAVDFAILVCEAPLIGYYSRLGWRLFAGRLLVTQEGEPTEFTLNRVMTHPIRSTGPASGTIDLAGPPW